MNIVSAIGWLSGILYYGMLGVALYLGFRRVAQRTE